MYILYSEYENTLCSQPNNENRRNFGFSTRVSSTRNRTTACFTKRTIISEFYDDKLLTRKSGFRIFIPNTMLLLLRDFFFFFELLRVENQQFNIIITSYFHFTELIFFRLIISISSFSFSRCFAIYLYCTDSAPNGAISTKL